MYVATVLLRRSEAQFWRMTPRKINALFKVHIEINKKDQDAGPKQAFIDQVF